MERLQVALLGTRGIPARYGGFETFAEQISKRLTARGHSVTVFGRRRFFERKPFEEYGGVRVVHTPTIMHKYLETPLHSLTSFLYVFFFGGKYDVILLCNAANSPFAWISKLRRIPLVINVDGIERLRSKWNAFGRAWYMLGERCSVWFATRIVSDAGVIAKYYEETYNTDSDVIAYGAEVVHREPGKVLSEFHLTPGKYILYVSRLEPENNALGVIQAYNKVKTDMPLVIVGDAPYADEYKAALKNEASDGVVFTGFQFGEAYEELRSHCYLYIQATEVGGTHPALVEAMAYGNCTIANGTPENREVLGNAGEFYSRNDFSELAGKIEMFLQSPESVKSYSAAAIKRAEEVYSWDKVTDQYERLFARLCFPSTL